MVLVVISDVQIVLDLQVKQIGNKDFFFFSSSGNSFDPLLQI